MVSKSVTAVAAKFFLRSRNQQHTKYPEWGGPIGDLVPGLRSCMILVTGRRLSLYLWSHRIGGVLNSLPGQWFVPRDGARFLVF